MMTTEQKSIDLIIQKLDKLDRKVDDNAKDIKTEIALVNKDLTWLKWLFGIFSSLIVVLLSTLLTVTFKLLGS